MEDEKECVICGEDNQGWLCYAMECKSGTICLTCKQWLISHLKDKGDYIE